MRELGSSEKNKLTIKDARSGSEIELYYRNPTTTEIAGYQKSLVKKRGNKVIMNTHQTRLEFGLKVLTGFKEGDFGLDGKPISSDTNSPAFRTDWKDVVATGAQDLILILARVVFEGASIKGDEPEVIGEEEIENTVPLDKS